MTIATIERTQLIPCFTGHPHIGAAGRNGPVAHDITSGISGDSSNGKNLNKALIFFGHAGRARPAFLEGRSLAMACRSFTNSVGAGPQQPAEETRCGRDSQTCYRPLVCPTCKSRLGKTVQTKRAKIKLQTIEGQRQRRRTQGNFSSPRRIFGAA